MNTRQADNNNEHDNNCWESHHKTDRRLTILEVKTDNLAASLDTMSSKQADTTDQLNALRILFERFFTKFETHIDNDEARQITFDNKIERLVGLDTKMNALWSFIKILATVCTVLIAGMYAVQKDYGIFSSAQTVTPTRK
ncbi:MAG: hypothetical protein ACXW2E_01045 [Nitrososphaeraceae archaeon]